MLPRLKADSFSCERILLLILRMFVMIYICSSELTVILVCEYVLRLSVLFEVNNND